MQLKQYFLYLIMKNLSIIRKLFDREVRFTSIRVFGITCTTYERQGGKHAS